MAFCCCDTSYSYPRGKERGFNCLRLEVYVIAVIEERKLGSSASKGQLLHILGGGGKCSQATKHCVKTIVACVGSVSQVNEPPV